MLLESLHHIAIICSDYNVSKKFYTEILGFEVIAEYYRKERKSWKCDLSMHGKYTLELFSFPEPPKRISSPEATGLRHLAFAVKNIDLAVIDLKSKGITLEPVRVDEYTGRRFTFFADPDNLPLELYEQSV